MGDAVELSFDGGWWDMEVTAVAEAAEATAQWDAMGAEAAAAEGAAEGARRFSLSSTRFVGAEHTVGGERLRQPLEWDPATREWADASQPAAHLLDGAMAEA